MAQLKTAHFLVLSIVVVTSFFGNQLLFGQSRNHGLQQRAPASQQSSFSSINEDAQAALLERLATTKVRVLASIGKQPEPLDHLRFGVLEGKYALTMSGEKVKDIEFINTPNSEGSPTQVADRLIFLKSNAQLLNIKSEIEKLDTDIIGRKIVETFKAVSADSNLEVKIKVEIDELDRLYKISSVEINRIF